MYSFKQILGHKDIINHMSSAFRHNKISHAYIIEGEEGIGKKTLVNAFTKLLQCENPTDTEPCHKCASCLQIESGNHPDVIYVKPSKKSGYGVADIRDQIIRDITIKPYKSDYKIYIIEESDLMTVQAQNSILKTIEEPPEYGLFFLLASNSQRFLQTILSRTVKMSLKPIPLEIIEKYLISEENINTKEARVFSSFSRGNLGKALILKSSEEFMEQRQNMLKCLELFINMKEYDIMEAVKLLEGYKDVILDVFDILTSLIRDILYFQSTENADGIIHQDIDRQIIGLSRKARAEYLIQLNANILQARSELRLNVNFSLAMMVMLTDMKSKPIN